MKYYLRLFIIFGIFVISYNNYAAENAPIIKQHQDLIKKYNHLVIESKKLQQQSSKTNLIEILLLIVSFIILALLAFLIFEYRILQSKIITGIGQNQNLLKKNTQSIINFPTQSQNSQTILDRHIKILIDKFKKIDIHQQHDLSEIRQENNILKETISKLKIQIDLLADNVLKQQNKALTEQLEQQQQAWQSYAAQYQENSNQINQALQNLLKQTTLNTVFDTKNPVKTITNLTLNIQKLEKSLASISLEKEQLTKQAKAIIKTIEPQASKETILNFSQLPEQLTDIFQHTATFKTQIDRQIIEQQTLLHLWIKDKENLMKFEFNEINQALEKLENQFIGKNKDEITDWYGFNKILAGFEEILYWNDWLNLPLDKNFINSLGHLLETTKILAAQAQFYILKYPLDTVEMHQSAHTFEQVINKLTPFFQDKEFELTELMTQNILDLLFILKTLNSPEFSIKEFLTMGLLNESVEEIQAKRKTRKRIYRFDALNIQGKELDKATVTQRY